MGKGLMRKMLALFAAVCMVLSMSVTVAAAEETSAAGTASGVVGTTEDPTDGILQVWLAYETDNGTRTLLSGGTCFLINDEYALSNYHIFDLDSETSSGATVREMAMALLGLNSLPDNDKHLKILVYANRDMATVATLDENVQSETMDFVALKLERKIADRTPLVLGDSSEVQQQDPVYALGFPSDSIENKEFNTKEDVSIVDGTISKVTTREKADVFEHTAPLNHGNSGGPLLNEENEVIGINTFMYGNSDGLKYYAIQINAIKSGLDTFGIPYPSGPNIVTGPTLEDLQNQISSLSSLEKDAYTADSWSALQSALDSARMTAEGNPSEEEIQAAVDELSAAQGNLVRADEENDSEEDDVVPEEEGPNWLIIGGIIAIAVIVIIVIIIIIVVVSGSKKKKAASVSGTGNMPMYGGDVHGPEPISPMPGPSPVSPAPNPSPVSPGGYPGTVGGGMAPGGYPYPEETGAGETTLLDSGAGETTLLSGAGGGAYLIRKKNGEKIFITSQNFVIGKERKKVNYCIPDNTSVSRCHAVITKKGSDYFIADQKSSNFTFVNGVQLSPYNETLLTDRSTVKLSDEEFEFHLS